MHKSKCETAFSNRLKEFDLYLQMQPFDLLGITIKSLAEIEKEVSMAPSERAGGAWACLLPTGSPVPCRSLSQERGGCRCAVLLGGKHFHVPQIYSLEKESHVDCVHCFKSVRTDTSLCSLKPRFSNAPSFKRWEEGDGHAIASLSFLGSTLCRQ